MRPTTSLYLDVLRLTAAFIVFFNHCLQFWRPQGKEPTTSIAHSAVVVFFVLSGYVISYSTLSRARDPRRFAAARLARLYSVVLPALALTLALQLAGHSLNPAFYAEHSRGHDGMRYLLTGLFLQNVWQFAASPPTNAPFWSLSYEFWYYVMFGVSVFVRRAAWRVASLLAIGVLVGPNILLLLPCWLVGVAIFIGRERLAGMITHPRLAFGGSALALALVVAFLPLWPYGLESQRFWFSGAFAADWVTALAVGATIVTFDRLELALPRWSGLDWIRRGADHTFSLYLYHYPLLAFATAVVAFDHAALWPALGVGTGVLGIALALSAATEARREDWRRLFGRALERGRAAPG